MLTNEDLEKIMVDAIAGFIEWLADRGIYLMEAPIGEVDAWRSALGHMTSRDIAKEWLYTSNPDDKYSGDMK